MIRRLSFNPADPDHRRCYELGHVLLVTDNTPKSRTEEDRVVDLQDDWESHGHKADDEKLAGTGEFTTYKYTINEDDEPFDLYIEEQAFDLLKKVVTEAPVMGHVRRFRRPLIAFVDSAEKGKLVEGVFTAKSEEKPVKAEDRALPRGGKKRAAATAAVAEE